VGGARGSVGKRLLKRRGAGVTGGSFAEVKKKNHRLTKVEKRPRRGIGERCRTNTVSGLKKQKSRGDKGRGIWMEWGKQEKNFPRTLVGGSKMFRPKTRKNHYGWL